MFPNKKTEQFARACALRPSTKDLAPYLLRRADKFKPVEVLLDLREWNKEIARDRPKGEYDRKTAKEALAQLNDDTYGWFAITKTYTWAIHKVLVRPVDYAINLKSQNEGKSPKLTTTNPMFEAVRKKRVDNLLLQNISKLDSLLRSIGMKCNQETLYRMWRYAGQKISNVVDAVEYMLRVNREKIERSRCPGFDGEGITSPIGWLHDCLKYGRYLEAEQVQLHPYDPILALANFVKTKLSSGLDPCDRSRLRYQT